MKRERRIHICINSFNKYSLSTNYVPVRFIWCEHIIQRWKICIIKILAIHHDWGCFGAQNALGIEEPWGEGEILKKKLVFELDS